MREWRQEWAGVHETFLRGGKLPVISIVSVETRDASPRLPGGKADAFRVKHSPGLRSVVPPATIIAAATLNRPEPTARRTSHDDARTWSRPRWQDHQRGLARVAGCQLQGGRQSRTRVNAAIARDPQRTSNSSDLNRGSRESSPGYQGHTRPRGTPGTPHQSTGTGTTPAPELARGRLYCVDSEVPPPPNSR